MLRRMALLERKSVGPDGLALRSVANPLERTWTGVKIPSRRAARTFRSSMSRFLEFFGKCGASRILMAGAQSVSRGVGAD